MNVSGPEEDRVLFEIRDNRVTLDDESIVEVPEFDLDRLRECCSLAEITHWEPGKLIRWQRKPLSADDWKTLVRIGAVLGGMFGAVAGVVAISGVHAAVAALIGAAVGAVLMVLLFVILLPYSYPALNVEIDFQQRVIRWRVGIRKGQTQFQDIAWLSLRGILEHEAPRGKGTSTGRPIYRCALELVNVRGKVRILIESERRRRSRNQAVCDVAPLVALLAEEIGAPWNFREFTPLESTVVDWLSGGGS